MKIHFTKHAEEKFDILSRHGVAISKKQVMETVHAPDVLDDKRLPLYFAKAPYNNEHTLKVVYKKEFGIAVIITFYPGKK